MDGSHEHRKRRFRHEFRGSLVKSSPEVSGGEAEVCMELARESHRQVLELAVAVDETPLDLLTCLCI